MFLAWVLALALAPGAQAVSNTKPLLDLSGSQALKKVRASSEDVKVSREPNALRVAVKPGNSDWPGIQVEPEGLVWDLSKFGHVEARITDVGTKPITVALRVDDDGDWKTDPWNAENETIKPGETRTVLVRFGYSWGKPGHALKSARVAHVLIYTSKAQEELDYRVDSLVAGGEPGEKPPVAPGELRIKPVGGVILGGAASARELQLETVAGEASTVPGANAAAIEVKCNGATHVTLHPRMGMWYLRDYLEIRLHLQNTGSSINNFGIRVKSRSGDGEWSPPRPLGPLEEADVIVRFQGSPIQLQTDGRNTAGTLLESDCVTGIEVMQHEKGTGSFRISAVRASVPPPDKISEWQGKHPPVPGNWKQTLAEEFNGPTINEKIWTIYHPNYWDKQSHFSKSNVILKDGKVRLRFEKKQGPADDDPGKPTTDYATGFLTTTHKWTQLYGYFECRMKLPRAPGLWPAFWMMPDRGDAAGAAREDTHNGGMEIDILEYLSRYGPYRYNIATHWDGYDKDHRSTGTDHIYVQPDHEGFYTAGLLWEPGTLTFYCNGTAVAQWRDPRVCSVPMYVLFTAVSGGWGGNDLTGEGLPDDLVIDYVRAWQRVDAK